MTEDLKRAIEYIIWLLNTYEELDHDAYSSDDFVLEIDDFLKEIEQKQVVIEVHGGVAEVRNKPEGVDVKIIDHDHR